MVGVGKVYDNLMIDVKATNQKLIDRSVRIIQEICAITYDEAMALYQVSEHDVKVATVMGMCGISKEEATRRLLNNGDIVKRAIKIDNLRRDLNDQRTTTCRTNYCCSR